MEASRTPIYTYCHGYAMSAGLTIFVSGHKRFAGRHARFMIHQPSEDIGQGKLSELEGRINEMKELEQIRNDIIRSKTKVRDHMLSDVNYYAADQFFNATTAINLGFADEII